MERKSGLQARNFYGEGTDRRGWKPLLPILTQVARYKEQPLWNIPISDGLDYE